MRVLTVIADPSPKSSCHAILAEFSKGLADAGHTNEVVDLYAITLIRSSGGMILPATFTRVCSLKS